MAKKRNRVLSMRKIREILRLSLACNIAHREIARSCSISHVTVGNYIRKVKDAGITYEELEKMDDVALSHLLGCSEGEKVIKRRSEPDWSLIHKEMRKPGVTCQLLWQEYKDAHPDGYQSTQFYEHYNQWKKTLKLSMRQVHKAGEKMFVDYAGKSLSVINPHTGEIKQVEIFVAVLGASNYTYTEATWDQTLPNWIGSHVRAFEYFKGVPKVIVPDNLLTGVSRACRYEPDINPTYHDMAVHYGTVIIPARVRKPKDKSKVEVGVQVVERWIMASLRNRDFFSISELNGAIWVLLKRLNEKPFKKLEGSRLSWFETIERDALMPLPQVRYVFSQWKKARVNIDYHVELDSHYYSVPYKLVGKEVDLRYTSSTVEIFYKGKRVASHIRQNKPGWHTTQEDHMPNNHREYLGWTPARIIRWAGKVGDATAQIIENIMNSRKYPEQGYRSCLGILRLGKKYSDERLEAACSRAIQIGSCRYKTINSILEKGLDKQDLQKRAPQPCIEHENIRGGDYYN